MFNTHSANRSPRGTSARTSEGGGRGQRVVEGRGKEGFLNCYEPPALLAGPRGQQHLLVVCLRGKNNRLITGASAVIKHTVSCCNSGSWETSTFKVARGSATQKKWMRANEHKQQRSRQTSLWDTVESTGCARDTAPSTFHFILKRKHSAALKLLACHQYFLRILFWTFLNLSILFSKGLVLSATCGFFLVMKQIDKYFFSSFKSREVNTFCLSLISAL